MAKAKASKIKRNANKDVLVPLDKQTVEEILRLSEVTHFTPKQMVRWLTWLGRKTMGRTLLIKEKDKQLEISLEEFTKITKELDLN